MKQIVIKGIVIFSLLSGLLFSPLSTTAVSAAADDLLISGITTPSEANGTYSLAGTYSGYNYWSYTPGTTTYVLYNDPYGTGSRYWNLDTDFYDEGTASVLFYSSVSTSSPPTGLTWSADTGVGTLNVDTGTPSPEIAVLGNGNAIADGNTAISSALFTNIGSASVSGGTTSRTFTINNSGSAALTLSGALPYISISGPNASSFSITTAPAQSIPAPAGTTTFVITFTPLSEGYHNAVITINNNDPDDEGVYTFNIQGYGFVARPLVVSDITEPSAANGTYLYQGLLNSFQYWKHETLNYYLYFDVYSGGGYWSIDNDTVVTKSYFYKGSEDGVPVGLIGWSIDNTVVPLPTGAPVVNYAVLAPEINIKGNGTSIAINDNTPSFADQTKFGSLDIATGSRTRTYTIENTGGAALTISGVTLGGSDASEFSKTNPVLTTIPAYGNTTFTGTFDPSTEGPKTATLSIVSNDSDENPYIFTISGDAFIPKNLLVSDITTPSTANGTYIYQGLYHEYQYWKHESEEVYIYNDEYETAGNYWNIDLNQIDSDNNYLFYRSSDAAAPVGITSWSVNAIVGNESFGTPTIVFAGPEMDVKGTTNGTSIPDGSTTPNSGNDTDFGSAGVGAATLSRTFTIENTGSEDLNLSGSPIVDLTGTNAGDFTVMTGPDSPVSAGGTTTFSIDFTPSDSGTRSAMVSIANNDSDENPYTFNIQGTGLTTPSLTTAAAAAVNTTAATLGGNITSNGGDAVTARGVVYSTTDTTPMIGGLDVIQETNGSGSGSFSEVITGLSMATHYYTQAYAINGQGTSYGGVEEFTTQNEVSSITRAGSALTNASSVTWNVEFGAPVTGLSDANLVLANTGLTLPSITGVSSSGSSWIVTASSGTGTGTLGLNLTSAAGLNVGLSNIPYTGQVYTIDHIPPAVTIEQASSQSDPTGSSPINFTVTFDETVMGFNADDISLSGTASAVTALVSGSGPTYNVAVSGMTGDGSVIAEVEAGGAQDAAGNTNTDSTSTDNQVDYDTARPSVVVSSTTTSPTQTSPISVTITFNETVTGFTPTTASGDMVLTNGTGSNPAGSGTTYTFDLTPSGQGPVTVTIPDGRAQDGAVNLNTVSNTFSITYDTTDPTVTIEQASTQADPTNAGTINFTATFSESVTDFDSSDVTLGGTAGATTAIVSGSGTTYNVAVNGMTMNGTVSATLTAGRAQDAALNPSEASTSIDNVVSYIVGPLDVSINQAPGQNDPTNGLPVNFTAVFGRAINLATFTSADITLGGTAPGTLAATISEISPNNGTTFNIAVNGLSGTGTVTAAIAANRVQDPASNENTASTTTDDSVTYDPGVPTISGTNLEPTLAPSLTSIVVNFSEAVYDNPLSDTETDDVTNPANYFLVEKGANGVSERTACNVNPPVTSDDVYISIDNVVYDSAAFTATLSINGGVALPVGQYEIFVCGTTSILDLAGNAINNGLSDYTYDFRVIQPGSGANLIPLTGFAPNRMTHLPLQPAWKAYSDSTLWLEIPALGLQQSIVGVPEAEGWDVTWLGDQIGYLGGTAFPTWAGNSVLTGHATNANGGKGPFAALGTLRWGDQIVIHAFGQEYIYEVRSVNRLTNPKDTSVVKKHEDLPWVTLITCNGFDEKTDTYRWRTVVRAVQISVIDEE